MTSPQEAKDSKGNPVRVGTRVHLLKAPKFLQQELEPAAWERVQSMVGQIFEVTEIDERGLAWIEKWWKKEEKNRLITITLDFLPKKWRSCHKLTKIQIEACSRSTLLCHPGMPVV